jgi:Arc/MetJ-type ribon-helix-helix transcriptional regulator
MEPNMIEAQTTTIQTEVPVNLAVQAQKLVEAGWFRNFDELLQDALRRFLESYREELMEEFIRQDVEWGLMGDE